VAEVAARRREQRGWYFYDWANSAYQTTVVAVFLGPYLTTVARTAAGCPPEADPCTGTVPVAGLDVAAGSYFSYALALSIVVQVVVLPVTGAIADRSSHKKQILALFAYLGALATTGMYFLEGDRYLLGGTLYLIAQMAFGASVVVYNAFLPEIAAPDERDRASSRGWALGYLGGGLLLLLNLGLYSAHDSLGLSESHAVRISLLSAGVWWAGFTLIPLARLRNRARPPLGPATGVVRSGFRQLRTTLREARAYPMTLFFLAAYLVYNDGIQSVIGLAAVYGAEELALEQGTLITAILLVQFVAFFGALLLGRLARMFGAQRVVLASLVLWTAVVAAAYGLEEGAGGQFFALAAFIGLVLGGSQALSRSLFSQMIPRGKEAEYFSLYEISERGTSWLGALTFGLVYQLTGSYRQALVSIVAFFVLGFVLLARVDVRRAIRDAGNEQPTVV
jgi:MFS transporter, UMF1 family